MRMMKSLKKIDWVPCPESPCQAEKRGDKTPFVKRGTSCRVCINWADGFE